MNEREAKEQRIRDLLASLTSTSSRIGDWIVVKCLEYKDRGLPMPDGYDLEEIYAERQKVRDEINTIQSELSTMVIDEENNAGNTQQYTMY